ATMARYMCPRSSSQDSIPRGSSLASRLILSATYRSRARECCCSAAWRFGGGRECGDGRLQRRKSKAPAEPARKIQSGRAQPHSKTWRSYEALGGSLVNVGADHKIPESIARPNNSSNVRQFML